MAFTLSENSALLTPVTLGSVTATNRIFMAPLTRTRADADGTPSALATTYYGQRAGAGLIISEATAVSRKANGAYVNTPGLFADRHQQRWAQIADAVHAEGGRMFVQLWHVGRMAHPDISGVETVGPSPIAADLAAHTATGKKPLPVPRALDTREIADIVDDFRAAARRAADAGLDGVEIHSANGYLLHEFLSDVVNRRTDVYGGSAPNRARLTAEVVEAVAAEIGADRVGLRISPGNGAGDMREVDEIGAYEALLCRIAPLGIAYLHVLADPSQPAFAAVRTQWEGKLVLNTPREHDTDFEVLDNLARWGVISAAAVGRAFLANPDLVTRLVVGAELNEPDPTTFYAFGAAGYVDYPTLEQMAAAPRSA
ncbi:1,2-oxophytodienoate reductase [Mycobacterium sp. NAZ190054]|uniref:oxidoreductase n=1 Tax=Mycobacterium sp. NAZ190054 TaxID=1747766 RepID=UPI00079A7C70|nr:1,2-oxophytodienoate reductase [Mycobacterium sp. NAZ190054]KWX57261.1 1,2-oxophytodienoate reductase [Mycobacterium sp. NAZ190054]